MKELLFLLIGAVLAVWILKDNLKLQVTEYSVVQKHLPEAFSGFRIVQVSDLHNGKFGDGNVKLLQRIQNAAPDIIVITGDLLDGSRPNLQGALDFAEKAVVIAPCYYVPGNHEGRNPGFHKLETGLRERGIRVLRDEKTVLTIGEERITLLGLDDQEFDIQRVGVENAPSSFRRRLERLSEKAEGYTILLCHRPEKLPVFAEYPVDLVFSGHAHGGQVRIPGIGGLYAPEQGLFPRYTAGINRCGGTTMVVSRGLSIRLLPFRVNNPPELVVVQLECDQDSVAV